MIWIPTDTYRDRRPHACNEGQLLTFTVSIQRVPKVVVQALIAGGPCSVVLAVEAHSISGVADRAQGWVYIAIAATHVADTDLKEHNNNDI